MMDMDERLSLAIKYYQSNVDDQARALVDEVLAEPNPSAEAISFAATLAFERRDLETALGYCERLLEAEPDDAHTLLLKGRALSDLGDQKAALQALELAVRADAGLAAAHYNLGWIRQRVGDMLGAIEAYRSAIALQEPYPVAWNNLGLVLEQIGDWDGAITAFQTALDQFPGFVMAHTNLGAARAASGRYQEAVLAYRDALELDPGDVNALTNLGVALLEQGHLDAAAAALDDALEVDPHHMAALDNRLYAEMYRGDDDAALRDTHAAASAHLQSAVSVASLTRTPDPERTLRVGFISPDFRRHSVSFFALPLVQNLDRNRTTAVLFSDVSQPDAITESFRAVSSEFHTIVGLSDTDVTEAMRAAQLDVVVDLAGRTTGNRLAVLASRVAPIQVMAIGYPGPTGVAAVDYWLCDAVTNPPGLGDDARSDQPLRMDRGFHVFAPPQSAPSVSPLPSDSCGYLTFGSFNKLAKISDGCVALWAEVLSAVPDSRLLLKAKALTEAETTSALKARFAAHGIAETRVECLGWAADDADHLGLYEHIDIALDTFPYNGTTTTCEALWMGAPVLTLCGNSHASRVGASLLTSCGLEEWIAQSPTIFVEKAKAHADDLQALNSCRATLRSRMTSSPLCDGAGAAHSFEMAIRRAWKDLCVQQIR